MRCCHQRSGRERPVESKGLPSARLWPLVDRRLKALMIDVHEPERADRSTGPRRTEAASRGITGQLAPPFGYYY